MALASTSSAAVIHALARPGLAVIPRGREAAALASLPVTLLERFAAVRDGRLEPGSGPAPAPASGGWRHPRDQRPASREMAQMLGTVAAPGARRKAEQARKAAVADGARVDVLRRWGIRTLGALAALPAADLSARLGQGGVDWQRLAAGADDRPLVPWVPEPVFARTMALEWPIEGLEPLSFVLARLLEPLAGDLERADRGAVVLHTHLRLVTRSVHRRALQLPAPMRDPKTLRTLILLDLESHPPSAGIDTVTVHVEPSPARVLQWTLFERAAPAPESVSTLVARLTALMGEGHVGTPALVDTWRPGAFEIRPFTATLAPAAEPAPAAPPVPGAALRRFRLPIPARVTMREGRPVRVQVDRRGLSTGAVIQAAGPWRTSGDWWATPPGPPVRRPEAGRHAEGGEAPSSVSSVSVSSVCSVPWDRDEWDLALADGTLYRVFVEREVGQWFIEGIVD
ncbi:MAG: hypothetical protein AB7O67_02320 [Vicinamibacterales bacterium]